MTSKTAPQRGEIWTVDLDPTRDHEQSGKRPALVISATSFNQGPGEVLIVLPITSRNKRIPIHVRIAPPEGGLHSVSYIKCEDIRSVALERFSRRWGSISPATLLEVEEYIRTLLEL